MIDQLVLRNTEHRKLSADKGAGSAHGEPRPGEGATPLLPDQLPRVDGHTEGHRPSGVKADTVEHRPTGRRVHSRIALSRKSTGIRPTYTIQPGPFGPGAAWPYTTIGRVFTGTNRDQRTWDWSGSGTLVGPNLLLTASHVAPWAASNAFWWMKFVANYADGNGVASSWVQTFRGVARYPDGSGGDTGHDVAICRLYSSIGQTVGWMGSQSWHDLSTYENISNSLFTIGYPGAYKNAEEPEWAYFPNLHDTDDDSQGAIELECDDFTSPGWSGGPLYGPIDNQWKVVGVCSDSQSEYIFPASVEHDSVFAGGSWMVGLIQYGFANWPS
jgi:V8-like Glu-specific endopeptidase